MSESNDLEHGIRHVDVLVTASNFINGAMDPDRTMYALMLACTEAEIDITRYTVGEAEMVARGGELFMRFALHPGKEDTPDAPTGPQIPHLKVVDE